MFDFIKNLWPTKEFALHVSDERLQAVLLKEDKAGVAVEQMSELALEAGIVVNGDIKKGKILAEKVGELLAKAQPGAIKGKKVRLALPEQQVYERLFYLPRELKGEDFKTELDKLIKESLPIPFHEVKYDFHAYWLGNVQVVYVVAAQRLSLAKYYEVLKTFAGLNPTVFEPESLSLVRNLDVRLSNDQGVLLLDVGEKNVKWYALLDQCVFDTEVEETAKILGNIEGFGKEVQNTMHAFKRNTNREIKQLMIVGSALKAKELSEQLAPNLGLEVQMPKMKAGEIKWRTTAGAALATTKQDMSIKINLIRH